MKKKIQGLFAILLLLCCASFLFACDGSQEKPSIVTYKVVFHDAATTVAERTVEKGGTIENLPDVSKDDYTFGGWLIDNDPTRPFDETTIVNSNLDVYASWSKVYTVTYDLQGGTGPTDGKEYTAKSGEKIVLPTESGFAKNELGLYAWSDGDREYAPGAEYTMPSVNITFQAVWKTIYTARFDIAGAEGETPAAVRSTRSVVLPSGEGLSKAGYEFVGWSDGEENYKSGDAVALKADVTFKALFKGEYTLTLDPDGGSLTGETQFTKISGETVLLPLPERDSAYEFLYWSDGNNRFAAEENFTIGYENVILTAVWEIPVYTVNFADWDGKVFATQSVKKGEDATEPQTPITSIPEFNGWSQPLTAIAGDCTITATYMITTYSNEVFSFKESGDGYLLSVVDSNFRKTLTEFYFPATYRGKLVTGTIDGKNNGLFSTSDTIEKIVFPSTYLTIGDYTCYNLRKLTDITFGGNEKSFGVRAFAYCWELPSFTVPASVTEIGSQALWALTNVQAFAVEEGSETFAVTKDGVLTDKAGTTLLYYPLGNKSTSYEVSSEITAIGNYAFNHAGVFFYESEPYYLTSVTFEENSKLESVGEYAFSYAKFDIVFPSSLKNVGKNAFREMYGTVTLSEGIETIGDEAFHLYRGENVYLPSTVKTLGNYSFAECTHLLNVQFPNGCNVENIGDYAFYESQKITGFDFGKIKTIGAYAFSAGTGFAMYLSGAISFPASIESIGDFAFSMNAALTSVTFANNNLLTYLGPGAFGECPKLESVDFGVSSALTAIPNHCFYMCESLKSVQLSDKIETIGMLAFGGAEDPVVDMRYVKLTEIVLPASLKGIMSGAFMFCYDLEKVVVQGENLETIGGTAFKHCEALTEINLPSSVTKIYPQAFERCYALKNLTVAGGSYHMSGGGLYENATNTLLFAYVGDDGVFTVEEGTKAIESYTFYQHEKIREISLPASLEKIGDYAFCQAYALTTVSQAENGSLKTIGKYAFAGSMLEGEGKMHITSFRFDEGLVSIGQDAFFGNVDIKTLSFPASLETIDAYAFYGMTSLESVEFASDSKLTVLSTAAFYNATALKKIVFGARSSLQQMQGICFAQCKAVESLVLTSSEVVTMGNNSFVSEQAVVYVPDRLVDSYKTNPSWKKFEIRAVSQYVD